MKAARVDICIMIVFLMGAAGFCIPLCLGIEGEESVYWSFVFVLLSGFGFCANLDNWNEGTGLGKTDNLVIIDLKTNQRAAWWQKIFRRGMDFLMLLLGAWLVFFFGFTFSIFLYFTLIIFTANILLIYIGKGRRLGDYVVGTQVVDLADFETKNYEVEKKQKRVVMNVGIGNEMQNQFINSDHSMNFPNPPQKYF